MSTSAQWHKQASQLTLAGEVDFNNVVALLREAEDWLKHSVGAQLTLDMSGVVYSNSAGIALIMSLHRRAHALGKQLILERVPANLLSMARLGGLDWLLDNAGGEIQGEVAAP
jgi:anti-anti-sigma factor